MVLANSTSARMIDVKQQRIADLHYALLYLDQVSEQVAGLFLRIGDSELDALAPHLAGIADLTAALAVERRLVHDHRAALALLQLGNLLAVLHQGGNHAFGALGFIAEEFGRAVLLAQRKPHSFLRRLARSRPGRARLC